MMTRRFLIALLAIVMSAHVTGCTSGGSSNDTEVAESNDETFAEEGEGDFADESADESTDVADESTTEETTEDAGESVADADAAPTDELALDGDQSTTTETTEVATEEAAPTDELSLDDPSALPEDVAANTDQPENITEAPVAPSDEAVFTEPAPEASSLAADIPTEPVAPTETFAADTPSYTEPTPVSAPPVYSPYLKMKETSFTAASGDTMNRVYLARPKDTAKGIATKVYGDASRSRDIVKWNPILKRGVRTGDKIYYTSPSNPSDTRMLTYQEEANIPPQMYVAKDSDNFRETAKSLLGFNDAWKEVYATNANLTEKSGRIPTGLELRYWPETGESAMPITTAQTTPPVEPDMNSGIPSTLPDQAPAAQPPMDQSMASAPPADPFQANPPAVAQNDSAMPQSGVDPLAPPPPMPDDSLNAGAAATVGGADPLAPPPVAAPEAPPKPVVKRAPVPEAEEGMDADTTMALGVGAVLLLAAAMLFVVIRKNRAKRMDLGQTQV